MFQFGIEVDHAEGNRRRVDHEVVDSDESDATDDDVPWGPKGNNYQTHAESDGDDGNTLSSSPGELISPRRYSSQQLAQFDRVDDGSAAAYDVDSEPRAFRGSAATAQPSARSSSRTQSSSTTSSPASSHVLIRSHVNLSFGIRADVSIALAYGLPANDTLKSKVLKRLAKQAVANIKSTSMTECIIELRGPSTDALRLAEGTVVIYKLPKVSGDSKNLALGPLCDDADVIYQRPLSELLDACLKDLGRRDTVTFRYVAKQYARQLGYYAHSSGQQSGTGGNDPLARTVSLSRVASLDERHSDDGAGSGSSQLESSMHDMRVSDSAILPPAARAIEGSVDADPLSASAATAAPSATDTAPQQQATHSKGKKEGSNVLYRRLKLYLPPQPCFGSIGLSVQFAAKSAKVLRPNASDLLRQSTKYNFLDVRFHNSTTRDVWWEMLRSMLGTQLLHQVREGSEDEAEARREQAQEVIDDMVGHLPSVDKFVEYFRSDLEDPADVKGDGAVAVRNTMAPPDGGQIEVVFGPLHRKPRKISIERMWTRGPDGEQVQREPPAQSEPHLVIGPSNLRQRLRMVPSHAFPLRTLSVCAQDDQWGNTFYLERRDAASVTHSLTSTHARKVYVEPSLKPKPPSSPEVTIPSSTPQASPPASTLHSPASSQPPHRMPETMPQGTMEGDGQAIAPDGGTPTGPTAHESPRGVAPATPSQLYEATEPYLRIELSTKSFVQRLKWMQWFAKVLGKPVVYVHDSTRDTTPLEDAATHEAHEAGGGTITTVEGEDGTITTRVVHRRPMFAWVYARATAPPPHLKSTQRAASLFSNRSFATKKDPANSSPSAMTPTTKSTPLTSPSTSPLEVVDVAVSIEESGAVPPPAAVAIEEEVQVEPTTPQQHPTSEAATTTRGDVVTAAHAADPVSAVALATGRRTEVNIDAKQRRIPGEMNAALPSPAHSAASSGARVHNALTSQSDRDAASMGEQRIRSHTISEGTREYHNDNKVHADKVYDKVHAAERSSHADAFQSSNGDGAQRHKRDGRPGRGSGTSSDSVPRCVNEGASYDGEASLRVPPPVLIVEDPSADEPQLVVGCDVVWVRKPPSEEDSLLAQWSPCRLCILQTPHSTPSPTQIFDSRAMRQAFDVFHCTVGYDLCLAAEWITRARVVMKPILTLQEGRVGGNLSSWEDPNLSSSARGGPSVAGGRDWSALLDAIASTDDEHDDFTAATEGGTAVIKETPVLELYFDEEHAADALDRYMRHHHDTNGGDGVLLPAGTDSGAGSWVRSAMIEACAFHQPLELCVVAPTSTSDLGEYGEGNEPSLRWALDVARALVPFLPSVALQTFASE